MIRRQPWFDFHCSQGTRVFPSPVKDTAFLLSFHSIHSWIGSNFGIPRAFRFPVRWYIAQIAGIFSNPPWTCQASYERTYRGFLLSVQTKMQTLPNATNSLVSSHLLTKITSELEVYQKNCENKLSLFYFHFAEKLASLFFHKSALVWPFHFRGKNPMAAKIMPFCVKTTKTIQ